MWHDRYLICDVTVVTLAPGLMEYSQTGVTVTHYVRSRGALSDAARGLGLANHGWCHWHRASDALSGVRSRLSENYDFNLSDQSGDDDISERVNMILLLILFSEVSAQSRPPKFKTLFYPHSPSSKPSGGGGYSGSSPSPTPAYSPPKSPSAGSPRPHNTGWSYPSVGKGCHPDIRYHH